MIVIAPVWATWVVLSMFVNNLKRKDSLPSVIASALMFLFTVLSACVYEDVIVTLPCSVLSSKSAAVILPLNICVSQYSVTGKSTFTACTM